MIKECPFCGSIRIVETLKGGTSICLACESLLNDEGKPTLFGRITTSPEVLAENMVMSVWVEATDNTLWVSSLLQKGKKKATFFETYEEAVAATVTKLKEIEN